MSLPLIIELPAHDLDLRGRMDWLQENGSWVDQSLSEHGAVLLRDLGPLSSQEFERVCRVITPELVRYVGGGSPRTSVSGYVYTSTEYASSAHIPLHCEGSYLPRMPRRVWFYCDRPSPVRGATPLGDMRQVRDRLPDDLVSKFDALGVLYVANLHNGAGFGKSWQQTYETEDRVEVEVYLTEMGEEFEWMKEDGLRVVARGSGLRRHSTTGEMIWVNQAANWHAGHLGRETYNRLIKAYRDPMALPKTAFYGDGSPIEIETIEAISEALSAEEKVFEWRRGDVLLIDNEVISHGRQSFEGERRILVALS